MRFQHVVSIHFGPATYKCICFYNMILMVELPMKLKAFSTHYKIQSNLIHIFPCSCVCVCKCEFWLSTQWKTIFLVVVYIERSRSFHMYAATLEATAIALVSSSASAETTLALVSFYCFKEHASPKKNEVILCVINPQMCIIEPFQSTAKPSKIILVLNFKPFSWYVTIS